MKASPFNLNDICVLTTHGGADSMPVGTKVRLTARLQDANDGVPRWYFDFVEGGYSQDLVVRDDWLQPCGQPSSFDLQRALQEGAQNRNGNVVTRLVHFPEINKLAGVLNGTLETWDDQGRYYGNESRSRLDLVDLPPKPRKAWIAIRVHGLYDSSTTLPTSGAYASVEAARDFISTRKSPDDWTIVKLNILV